MSHSKDPKQAEDDNYSGLSDNVLQHRDNAIKASMWLLAAMCGALIVILIFMAHPPTKATIISENQTMKGRIMEKVEDEFVMGACQLINCSIGCRNTSDIYFEVFQALQDSSCEEESILLYIYDQRFPNQMLENNWMPSEKVIKEVSIANGDFNNIRNEAFNSLDFTNTQDLKLVGIDISMLSNGVLLGLSKLYSLHIVGKVGEVHRCFFQPVQSSLLRLTLSVGLTISGESNVFGISYLPNLTALDLSDNTITGSVTRQFFAAVPNVKFLTLSNSKITSFDEDAFTDIANTLQLLDLSNDLLTSIDVSSLERILVLGQINIYLLGNEWYCDCDLKPLINLYHVYEDQFRDMPYCKGPLPLYGVLFTNVDFGIECVSRSDEELILETTTVDSIDSSTTEQSTTEQSTTEQSTTEQNTTEQNPTTEIATSEENIPFSPFQMKCLSVVSLETSDDSSSSEQMEYFFFEPPCHEFQLNLLQNNSVQVVVEDADEQINIIWFSDAIENFVYTIDGITVDYNCEGYTKPYLIVDDLLDNSAYTFCLVPSGTNAITPFNCLPLYVPIRAHNNDIIWISADDKQFTVGIVCLIFICSMICGGVIAYFGIKAYPDLLEGSRHVLVVKKSDKTCYVSTITDYMDDPSMRKNSLGKKNCSNKNPLSCTHPSPQIPLPLKYDDTKDESLGETDNHYELPCIYNRTHDCQVQCIPNKYATSPTYPPPLPKRNSDIVFSSTNSELLTERYYSKMSF